MAGMKHGKSAGTILGLFGIIRIAHVPHAQSPHIKRWTDK